MANRVWRIGVSGSYGGTNLGDEAILEGILASLRAKADVEFSIFTHHCEDTLRRHDVEHAYDRPRLGRDEARAAIEPLDLFVLGGGGLLFDSGAESYLRELTMAQELAVPTMTYAISVGPLAKSSTRKLVQESLDRCDAITVRDRTAHRLLEEIGVQREIHLTADPALLLEPEPLEDEVLARDGLEPKRRRIAFSVREPGPAAPHIDPDVYHALLADAGDYVVDRLDADVVFVPLEREHLDLQHSHAVISKMRRADRALVLKGDYSPGQLVSLMSRFELAIGMRLHFIIFAILAGVPFVSLPYASKVSGFLDELDLEVPSFERGGAGQLIAYIDRSWDHRDALSKRVQSKLPELRARADETARIAISLLQEQEHAGPAAT